LNPSARSASTEKSDSLTFVLIHPGGEFGHTSRVRSAQAKESLSRVTERSIEGLLLQVCAESRGLNHLEVFENCRKECVQRTSLRLKE
jgi:hypothetical protein